MCCSMILVQKVTANTGADGGVSCVGAQAERARFFAAAQQQRLPLGLLSVRIYTAAYSGPLEKATFQGAVARESSVFADLIRAKQHLVLPLDMGQTGLQQVCGCCIVPPCLHAAGVSNQFRRRVCAVSSKASVNGRKG